MFVRAEHIPHNYQACSSCAFSDWKKKSSETTKSTMHLFNPSGNVMLIVFSVHKSSLIFN